MKWNGQLKKWAIVLIHIGIWALFFFLPILLRPSEGETGAGRTEDGSADKMYHNVVSWLSWAMLFYVNAYLLIPKFLYPKRYLRYVLSILSVFVVLHIINRISLKIFLPEHNSFLLAYILFFLFPSLFFLSLSTGIILFRDRIRDDAKSQAKETENLKTELAFLRSQVSPHFMFNILNSMVVLARKKSEELEPSLFKLSSLMRYMLYETDEKKVSLEKEMEYIRGYTDLQLQRFGNNLTLRLDLQPTDQPYLIEPMLLIPFVENAFKHGTGWKEKSDINIAMHTNAGRLHFEVNNYFEKLSDRNKDDTQGIGLQNVRKRLELLYGKNQSLEISSDGNRFIVHLQIKLD